MTVTELGGVRIEREIPGVGTLVFEDCKSGQWLTAKGEPAKKSRRRYLLDDRELDAVSSIVDTLDKFALRTWIEKEATIGAVRAARLGELDGVPDEELVERVKLLGLGATSKKEEGQDRGHYIHATLEALARGEAGPNPADAPAVARPWIQGAIRAWIALSPKPVLIEEMVCHPDLGYGGRPDLVAEINGKLTLLDWKTGKGRVYPEAHYQTRLYQMALELAGVNVERILLVGIDDDGGFELIECAASVADAVALLAVFKSRKAVNAAMAKQRAKAKKEAVEAARLAEKAAA